MRYYHFDDVQEGIVQPVRVRGDCGGAESDVIGAWRDASVLVGGEGVCDTGEVGGAARRIVWSGNWNEVEAEIEGEGDVDIGERARWEANPHTWGSKGWGALMQGLSEGRGPGPVLRTHARHVVSDLPGIARVMREVEGVEVLVDPASMLTEEMLRGGRVEDHLMRVFEGIVSAAMPRRVWGVIASGVAMREERAGTLGPVSLLDGRGVGKVAEIVRGCLRRIEMAGGTEGVVVLVGSDVEAQVEWLRG